MNDLDKRFNFDFDGGNTEPYGKRNVNLLISFNSDENLHNNSPTWLNNGSSKTNSDNGSISRSGTNMACLVMFMDLENTFNILLVYSCCKSHVFM